MDFIEQLFGFSPDGGNGIFELLLFALPIAGIVTLFAWRRRRPGSRQNTEGRETTSSRSRSKPDGGRSFGD